MFAKVLIANRGEIACRVISTCRRMRIAAVAVYSDADRDARHVRLAEESLRIGPPPARESYLNIDAILAAARESGAEAVHPGYGFLSENAEFAVACAEAGLVFIGPPADAIRAMGSKAAARQLMAAAGVPLVPGYDGEDQDPAVLRGHAEEIGYPVIIKASAGGGGKGMRVVGAPADFEAALAACRREAASSFGDERVLLEKYLERPRHIEVQVFGDSQGEIVHLFERDCSVQRRHQKVLEEAPAPGLSGERRAEIGSLACAAARAVGYVGAGTVEFIAAQDGTVHFMEMNTRLQVEHPVTEMITGQDLVEWQLRVAAGEALPLSQAELSIRGHAIEARIYAEDPQRDFLPSTGRLTYLRLPPQTADVRVDSGVDEGDEIAPYYDPMLAKLIVRGDTREEARSVMAEALQAIRIVGVAHNLAFLARLVANPAFAAADLDTGLIERERAWLFAPPRVVPGRVLGLAALGEVLREEAESAQAESARDLHSPWRRRDGWRIGTRLKRTLTFRDGEADRAVVVSYEAGGYRIEIENTSVPARVSLGEGGTLLGELGGERLSAGYVAEGDERHLFLGAESFRLTRVMPGSASARATGGALGLTAPMPGKIIALLAEPGEVARDAPLLVMEAMKMEHTISAPAAGILKRFRCAVGDQVAAGAELVEFEAAPPDP